MATSKKNDTIGDEEVEYLVDKVQRGGMQSLTPTERTRFAAILRKYPSLYQQLGLGGSGNGSRGGASQKNYMTGGGESGGITRTRPGLNRYLENASGGYGGGNRVVSPGGFSKSGLDADSQARMAGGLTDQRDGRNSAHLYTNGKAKFGNRVYTKSEVDSIIARAQTGATLGVADQSIYDRYLYLREQEQKQQQAQDAKKAKKAEDERLLKQREEQTKADREKYNYEEGVKTANEMRKIRLNAQLKAEEEERNRQQAEKLNDERLKYYGIAPGTHLSDEQWKQLDKGLKVWGYDSKAQKQMDDLDARIDAAASDPSTRAEDLEELRRQRDEYAKRFEKRLVDNPNRRTAEQILNGAVMHNGVEYYTDDNGALQKLDIRETPEERREFRQQELRERADERKQKRRDDFINDRFKEYRNATDNNTDKLLYTPQQATEMALADAEHRFAGEKDADAFAQQQGDEYAAPIGETCPNCGERSVFNGICSACGWMSDSQYAETPVENVQPVEENVQEPVQQGHVRSSYL